MNRVVLYFLLVAFAGCSSIRPISSKTQVKGANLPADHIPTAVDIGLPEVGELGGGAVPQIFPNEETVRLGDRGGDVFTPLDESQGSGSSVSKKLRIGLSLGPGLYRSINYVSLLKALERQNLAPQVITGTGFGAIVAAMYATGMTPEMIEWNFYRYFKEKRRYRPYDQEWVEEIDNLLLDKLKNKTIQSATKKLYITLYNSKTKKTYYFDKGNIRDLLLMNLKLNSQVKDKKGKSQYSTAFESEVFNPGLMKRLGVDFAIGADILGTKFDFEESNEFLIGIYGRAAGRIAREKKGFDYFYSIPLSKMSLDSTEDGAFYLLKTQEYVDAQSAPLRKLIQQKNSTNTKAFE